MSNNILLIEDTRKDELLTVRALRKSQVVNEVIILRDGQEAVDYLTDTSNELPMFVILDFKLPKLSGLEVLKHIRSDQRTRFLPVVMLTSSDDHRDMEAAYANGVNSFVSKPVDMAEFNVAVQELGLYWMIINQQP